MEFNAVRFIKLKQNNQVTEHNYYRKEAREREFIKASSSALLDSFLLLISIKIILNFFIVVSLHALVVSVCVIRIEIQYFNPSFRARSSCICPLSSSTKEMRNVLLIVLSVCSVASVVRSGSSDGFTKLRDTETAISLLEKKLMAPEVAMVPLTLIQGAGSKGAGTLSLSQTQIHRIGSYRWKQICQNLDPIFELMCSVLRWDVTWLSSRSWFWLRC